MQIDRKSSGKDERRVLIGLVTNRKLLSKVFSVWVQDGLFSSRWANIIGAWCVKYFEEYGEPPNRGIESIYETWAEQTTDKETVEVIGKFLRILSSEYERDDPLSGSYLIDLAGKHFNKVKLDRLARSIEGEVGRGRLSRAEQLVNEHSTIRMGVSEVIDLLSAKEEVMNAFESKRDPLLIYPGALGEFFGEAFERDGFLSFEGPEKRGKSFWLLDVAWRAMLQRRRVAMFECGDMSRSQVIRRFMARASHHPLRPGNVRWPRRMGKDEEGNVYVDSETRYFSEGLDWRTAYQACQRIMRIKLRTKRPLLKLSCHPADSLSAVELKHILQTWEREDNWVPDLVVVDYADILAAPNKSADLRDSTNRTWMQLRALSQELHCCVVTATQSSADAYSAHTIGMKHFSNDKRKRAHVTGSIGLNSIDEEEEQGLMRLNWVVLREGARNTKRCVYVAECRALSNPAVRSTF